MLYFHIKTKNKMAKQYKVKDINNNGKIDGWEQGKYDAINNSATKMGYAMKMGSKENYSPTNFKTKDAMLMMQSPMMMNDPDPKKIKGKGGTLTTGEEGNFVQRSGGPVTGGATNKLDEVILTPNMQQNNQNSSSNPPKQNYKTIKKKSGKIVRRKTKGDAKFVNRQHGYTLTPNKDKGEYLYNGKIVVWDKDKGKRIDVTHSSGGRNKNFLR